MVKYVALLRGINVGGRIIKMADLQACFERLGFQNVRTVLQTGNVLFEADPTDPKVLKQQLETALQAAFDYPAKVQVLEQARLAAIIQASPFIADSSDFHSYVVFLEQDLAEALAAEAGTPVPPEKIQLGDGVIYWWVNKGNTLKSPFAKYLVKPAYKACNTTRNLRTLQKLV